MTTSMNTKENEKEDFRMHAEIIRLEFSKAEDILLSDSSKDLLYWLQKYVLSTSKKSDEKYPPKAVYLLLCGLNRYIRKKINIFNRDNPNFKLLFKHLQ